MRDGRRWPAAMRALVGWVLGGTLLAAAPAQAHLMAAQKGTLNFVANAAFVVLSVPVSALHGVDDDQDGALSADELKAHFDAIGEQVKAGVQLVAPSGALPLQLVMLDIAAAENTPSSPSSPPAPYAPSPPSAQPAPSSHLVVLGRFAIDPPVANAAKPGAAASDGYTLRFALFGTHAGEREQHLTITRQQETQWLRFTPDHSSKALLPPAAAVFGEYVHAGAVHVLSGADHMLFLLVVLSAAWSLRALVSLLTCFTLGHAITLAACVWGGWSVSDRIVEPAIAATIVGMAGFDVWARRSARPVPLVLRLALVFACALVHGLGLGGALRDLTQWPTGSTPFALALAGFNVGIEVAQVGVAFLAYVVTRAVTRLGGPQAQQGLVHYGSVAGMVAGTFWFIERLALGA